MAVAVILLFVISVFAVGMMVIVFQPALFDLSFDTTFWEQCNESVGVDINTRLCIQRDTLYSGAIAIPIFAVGVAAIWSLLTINRRDDL